MLPNHLISVVVPAYNEQESLEIFLPQLVAVLEKQGSYEIIVINDGSCDQTADVVRRFHQQNPAIHLISFSRNFGAQAALRAGFHHARGECVISMDADMQHPVSVLAEMIAVWRDGYDIVYAVRRKSNHLGKFKRLTASLFYRLFRWLSGDKNDTGADFRLMSRRAVNALNQFSEHHLFLRGIISRLGFRKKMLYYDEAERKYGGKSRYTLKKMLNLALTGVLGLSVKPIHFVLGLGAFIFGCGCLGLIVLAIRYLCGMEIENTGIIICALALFSGIQMLALGIIGEYVGDISVSVKRRPHYLIEENTLEQE